MLVGLSRSLAGLLLLLSCLALHSCLQATEEVYPWQSGFRLAENNSRSKFEAMPHLVSCLGMDYTEGNGSSL